MSTVDYANGLIPVQIVAMPSDRSSYAPFGPLRRGKPIDCASTEPGERKPASATMLANSVCVGKRSIDSTKYWYDSRSPTSS